MARSKQTILQIDDKQAMKRYSTSLTLSSHSGRGAALTSHSLTNKENMSLFITFLWIPLIEFDLYLMFPFCKTSNETSSFTLQKPSLISEIQLAMGIPFSAPPLSETTAYIALSVFAKRKTEGHSVQGCVCHTAGAQYLLKEIYIINTF